MVIRKGIICAALQFLPYSYSGYNTLLLLWNLINCYYFISILIKYRFQMFHSKSKVSKLDLNISNFKKSYHLFSFFILRLISFKKTDLFIFISVNWLLVSRYICFWDYYLKNNFKFVLSPIFLPNPIHSISNSNSNHESNYELSLEANRNMGRAILLLFLWLHYLHNQIFLIKYKLTLKSS